MTLSGRRQAGEDVVCSKGRRDVMHLHDDIDNLLSEEGIEDGAESRRLASP